jgi:two-component system, OmpR family, sensor histidine kinase CpxA
VKVAVPLYLKFWLWLALNLLLLAGLLLVIAGRDGPGWRMLLTEPVRDRLVTIGADIGRVLAETPEDRWSTTLAQLGDLYGVSFDIERAPRDGGPPRKAENKDAPPEKKPPPRRAREPGTASASERPRPPDDAVAPRGPPRMDRRMRSDLITLRGGFVGPFQLTIPASIEPAGRPPMLYDVKANVGDLVNLLSFLGVQNWVLYPLLALGISALWWLPFVWHITRTVTRITATTERIAEGDFEARIEARSHDELGQLAHSVNRMAARLGGHLAAQKRFLADVAHEVASPLARLRVELGLLGATPPGTLSEQTLRDMHDDMQQMADMLNDLLLFSRAEITAGKRTLAAVQVATAAATAVEREGAKDRITVNVDADLGAFADPAMLERALANLVRNALRYAEKGPVELVAKSQDEYVAIQVRDRGPGVPAALLARLGEPFFRIDSARSRDQGGFGLGLAIVRRCVEACGGEVVFRNRDGGGFEAEIRLRAQRRDGGE